MTELLTAAQMRAIEAAAIASGEVTGLELMERAGQGVVAAIFEEWPEFAVAKRGGAAPETVFCGAKGSPPPVYSGQNESGAWRAVVLCGPGNNGGDGFVVARLLRDAGWDVAVYLYGDPDRLPAAAQVNYMRWMAMGAVSAFSSLCAVTHGPDVIIDAVFGTGLSRPLPDDVMAALIILFDRRGPAHFVGVDCASGICMDSGRPVGGAFDNPFDRDLIVQFHRAKLGQYLMPEAGNCWSLRVADIGLELEVDGAVRLTQPFARLRKGQTSHKYSHGHALVLSGCIASGGAARLAARGALRAGAGVVTVGCPPAALLVNAARLDAVMVKPVRDAAGLAAILEDMRINSLCLGPGLGLGARESDLLRVALHAHRLLVLVADALTLLARDAGLFALVHDRCVLTPHGGEFARLFPDIAAKLEDPAASGPAYSKVDATRDAAKRAGCVVLFKGPDTVIAAPDGRCSINAAVYDRAAPWLATAGSGDVLAGFITGLLARRFDPMQATETGAWLHVECARSFGPGLIAEDLPEELPKVFRAMGV